MRSTIRFVVATVAMFATFLAVTFGFYAFMVMVEWYRGELDSTIQRVIREVLAPVFGGYAGIGVALHFVPPPSSWSKWPLLLFITSAGYFLGVFIFTTTSMRSPEDTVLQSIIVVASPILAGAGGVTCYIRQVGHPDPRSAWQFVIGCLCSAGVGVLGGTAHMTYLHANQLTLPSTRPFANDAERLDSARGFSAQVDDAWATFIATVRTIENQADAEAAFQTGVTSWRSCFRSILHEGWDLPIANRSLDDLSAQVVSDAERLEAAVRELRSAYHAWESMLAGLDPGHYDRTFAKDTRDRAYQAIQRLRRTAAEIAGRPIVRR